jgi:predicted phage baseplate assembly protein
LRFGDGILGAEPVSGLRARYRTGNGAAGNVGTDAIAHVVTAVPGIQDVRNPLPAQGGIDPEPIQQVRLCAPQAFRTQERAVTAQDYAAVAERHPEVQRAEATRRWTGSWYTMFVTVERRHGRPVDPEFRRAVRDFLEQFRLAGYDLEIEAPIFVPLDIAMTVCVAPGYVRTDVEASLLRAFSARDLPDGRRGFFHPDNFTFGQPVYLSQIVATAMQVPGVMWVDTDDIPPAPNRFRRWGQAPRGETAAGRIAFERLEIPRLDNNASAPENGKVEFYMKGGR